MRTPLIIAGMHRSGTSLAASLLAGAGLDVGERLMEGNWSNPRGHFEDLDFVDLHKAILERLGLHIDGWALSELCALPEDLVEDARTLVTQRSAAPRPWGFKDPRGTLVLPMWADVAPTAFFVFVHRVPWEVINSLFRRGDEVFSARPELAILAWLHYNRTIVDFIRRAPDRCLLVNVETICEYPAAWIAEVSERAGLGLGPADAKILESGLLHGALCRARAGVVVEHYPEAIRLFGALEALAWRPAGTPAIPFRESFTPEVERELAMQDWHAICAALNDQDRLREELAAKASQEDLVDAAHAQPEVRTVDAPAGDGARAEAVVDGG